MEETGNVTCIKAANLLKMYIYKNNHQVDFLQKLRSNDHPIPSNKGGKEKPRMRKNITYHLLVSIFGILDTKLNENDMKQVFIFLCP